jgi:iron complex outermembrane recepter protein
VAFTDPKYTSYTGYVVQGTSPNQTLLPFNKSGYRIVGVVRKQWNVGANYETDLAFGKLTLNATYAWNSQMVQEALPYFQMVSTSTSTGGVGLSTAQADALYRALTTRPVGITNLRAALAFGAERNYEVALWGRNVFDQRATSYTLWLGGLNYAGTSWNEPATYGVTATVKF